MASNRVLCIIILAIWSWSLLQFTMVLTASPTKSKKSKLRVKEKKPNCCHTAKNVCCSVDVWSILINIILQDAPFFIFRLLLILHYKIISETNIFFTCKVLNPLVNAKFNLKMSHFGFDAEHVGHYSPILSTHRRSSRKAQRI